MVAAVLMLFYASSFIDQQIIGWVIEPIRSDLQFTDGQIGLLVGPAFVVRRLS